MALFCIFGPGLLVGLLLASLLRGVWRGRSIRPPLKCTPGRALACALACVLRRAPMHATGDTEHVHKEDVHKKPRPPPHKLTPPPHRPDRNASSDRQSDAHAAGVGVSRAQQKRARERAPMEHGMRNEMHEMPTEHEMRHLYARSEWEWQQPMPSPCSSLSPPSTAARAPSPELLAPTRTLARGARPRAPPPVRAKPSPHATTTSAASRAAARAPGKRQTGPRPACEGSGAGPPCPASRLGNSAAREQRLQMALAELAVERAHARIRHARTQATTADERVFEALMLQRQLERTAGLVIAHSKTTHKQTNAIKLLEC